MTIADSSRPTNDSKPVDAARQQAHIALVSLLPAGTVGSLLFILRRRIAWLQLIPAIPFGTALTHWLMPFLIVLLVERVPREARCAALGLTIKLESVGAYAGLGVLGLVLPAFIMQCDIHMESHPNDLTTESLEAITALGVQHLSIGVEALQDHHLRTLRRPYSAEQAIAAVGRAARNGFKCVNADLIFALPGQTVCEVEQAARVLVEIGADQVAAYPLFRFTYTHKGRNARGSNHSLPGILKRRQILRALETALYDAGFERTSVWAFTRKDVPRYCSVTVPLYLGLGASAGSYLRDAFYLNTFSVQAYIEALAEGRLPIALSLDLTEKMQMTGWPDWHIYETRFRRTDFQGRFGRSFDTVYGSLVKVLAAPGLLRSDEGD